MVSLTRALSMARASFSKLSHPSQDTLVQKPGQWRMARDTLADLFVTTSSQCWRQASYCVAFACGDQKGGGALVASPVAAERARKKSHRNCHVKV